MTSASTLSNVLLKKRLKRLPQARLHMLLAPRSWYVSFFLIQIIFIDDYGQQNIRSIAVAVLLSPKLAAYKGDTPKDCVLVSLSLSNDE